MKKSIISVLTMGGLVLFATANIAIGAESSNLPATGSKERFIAYETMADLDRDGKLEKVVLDGEKGEDYDRSWAAKYNRLLIYKLNNNKEELVFDSMQTGIPPFDGIEISKGELIRIADDDQNGTPEIYLMESGRPDVSITAIIENQGEGYQVLFHGPLGYFKYSDLDHDGTLELHGLTKLGGQVTFNSPVWTAYKRKDNKYLPSYSCTKILIDNMLQEAKSDFFNQPTSRSAERVISLYILGGDKQGLKDFMTEHQDALAKAHSLVEIYLSMGVDGFIANPNIESLFKRKGDWLKSLKQYSL